MSRVNRQQISEWVDHPVTLVVRKLSKRECENTKWMPISDVLYRGNPQKTQEQLIENAEKLTHWSAFVNVLDGHFEDEFVFDIESEEKFYKLVEEENEDDSE